MRLIATCLTFLSLLALSTADVHAAELKEISAVTDRVLCLRFDDAVMIRHESFGKGGADGAVTTEPLDTARAAQLGSYTLSAGVKVVRVGRKARPHDFVRNGQKTEWATEHWVYLLLDGPLVPGKAVTVTVTGGLVTRGPAALSFTFDQTRSRSEAVQVNQIGYLPDTPKRAFVSAWLGDLGPLDLAAPIVVRRFRVLPADGGNSVVFTGTVLLRKHLVDGADSGQPGEGNYVGADLYECDFSALKTPGRYIVAVDGVGCSFPFTIGSDIFRKPFVTTLRGLYHQRRGVALEGRYTRHPRPASHPPGKTIFRQTDHRYLDVAFSDGPKKGVAWKTTGEVRTDVIGGWHDAADWDSEMWHLNVPNHLLLAYELAPRNFRDGEANIPESGNGIPDIVDEARGGVDFFRRLQRPDGGVGAGIFASSFPKGGEASWTDTLEWYVYAEDPQASYRYAAAAARLASCLRLSGKPEPALPYVASARRAWDWAEKNQRAGDAEKIKDDRMHAAACLYRASGDTGFQTAFREGCRVTAETSPLSVWQQYDQQWATWTFALMPDGTPGLDKTFRERLRKAAVAWSRSENLDTAARRGHRLGYNWYLPLWWGRATLVEAPGLMVAHSLTGEAAFRDALVALADQTLGANPLNQCWVTGLGSRSPRQVMHFDSWYGGTGLVEGLVPMGPYRYSADTDAAGPWAPGFAWKAVYPDVKQWPPLELWFENKLCPPTNEFTVEGIASTAAAFGYLAGQSSQARAIKAQ